MSTKKIQQLRKRMKGKKKKKKEKSARAIALEGRRHFSSGGKVNESMDNYYKELV